MELGLRHLEHAVAVATHRSFRRAAEALGISQPGLSRSIAELERRLGTRLFERDRGGVELTATGELVVERGREMLLDRADLEAAVRAVERGVGGSITVDLGPYPAAIYGREVVARLLARHPGVGCELRVSHWRTAVAAVLERRSHLAVAELSVVDEDPRLESETLVSRQGAFVCRADHPVLGRGRVGIDDLVCWPWVSTELPARVARVLPRNMGRAGRWDPSTGHFLPAVRLELADGFGEIARVSEAVVLVTLTMVEAELERGELAVVPFAPPWLRLNAGFIRLRGRTPAPAVAVFTAIVREVETELAEREARLEARFGAPSRSPAS